MEVKYNGRLVDSDNFRVVMHHKDGFQRVAEGWDNYQSLLATGEWAESIGDVAKLEAPKNKRRRKVKAVSDDNGS
jgi:hypothetical protein